jgi:hypothetical protein
MTVRDTAFDRRRLSALPDRGRGAWIPIVIGTISLIAVATVIWFFARNSASSFTATPELEYERAVHESMALKPDGRSNALYKFDAPTVFATWTKSKWVPSYQRTNPLEAAKAPADIWVTDAASLKEFCRDFVNAHGPDKRRLELRLNQRLGLPPDTSNDTFVELQVDPAQPGQLFRPCADSTARLNQTSCEIPKEFPKEADVWAGLPKQPTDLRQEWILRKYYSSHASANPYPWTEFGYTFDWARAENGSNAFVRRGQTEFVIPKGDALHFISATPTLLYCTSE